MLGVVIQQHLENDVLYKQLQPKSHAPFDLIAEPSRTNNWQLLNSLMTLKRGNSLAEITGEKTEMLQIARSDLVFSCVTKTGLLHASCKHEALW